MMLYAESETYIHDKDDFATKLTSFQLFYFQSKGLVVLLLVKRVKEDTDLAPDYTQYAPTFTKEICLKIIKIMDLTTFF